ncbi:hypothetical protein M409DRAFT_24738 [Zasmidium cellare ATCC 36951]|uniref:Uncharacterized protein n=1 Tax=Zasmidium cellare ATCC 36951 TaxID=1080233 RepID=A0A6A6CDP1_ZASCE|nr:uncharacterized protein M409DRAFT_24738 [Zasmidium cellare ATCC 36951]KAF2164833.1 hypothetical protein M409DRAFT_24738 [Zasmidium cellare ATCC 36951]
MPMRLAALPEIIAMVGHAGIIGGATVGACAQSGSCPGWHNKRNVDMPEAVVTDILLANRQTGVGPCNVRQYNFDQCKDSLQGITISSSLPAPGEARFDNVPATCMNLATVLTGACGADGPAVQPCGSACLHYYGLTSNELKQLSAALKPMAK